MEKTEWKERTKVDKYRLDDACESQAESFLDVVEENYVKALTEKLKAERLVKEVEATIDLEIRSDTDKFSNYRKGGKDDLSDKAISSIVTKNPLVKAAHRKLIAARGELELWQGRKDAFEQRRSMIKYLVILWSGQYYKELNLNSDVVRGAKLMRSSDDKLYDEVKEEVGNDLTEEIFSLTKGEGK